jgi:hypothetical protein
MEQTFLAPVPPGYPSLPGTIGSLGGVVLNQRHCSLASLDPLECIGFPKGEVEPTETCSYDMGRNFRPSAYTLV